MHTDIPVLLFSAGAQVSTLTYETRMEFSFDFKPTGEPRLPDQAMCLLIVANFSGEKSSGSKRKRLRSVDIDTFDDLLESICPEITVASQSGKGTKLQVRSIDDFHPDQLYNNLPPFNELRELRRRLKSPATFKAAAAEITAGLAASESASPALASSAPPLEESADDAIERMLGRPSSPSPSSSSSESVIDNLIKNLVAPHITPGKDPQRDTLVRSIDASISTLMDQVLHTPEMQTLEARWRALFALVSNAELDENVEIYIWDTTREDLEVMVQHPDHEPMASGAAKLMASINTTASWSLVASDLSISPTDTDLIFAAKLASITRQFGSPLLACAAPTLYGCSTSIATSADSDEWLPATDATLELWEQLRRAPIAAWIGLVSPRLLQRMPYGAKTDPISPFNYEEFASEDHEKLLWGPASIACASLLAGAFCERQWNMRPNDNLDIEDLPSVITNRDGQRTLMPCAEAALNDRSAEAMLARGVMPMLSYKNRNAARLMQFQSISVDGASLAGPWNS
ncbi:MAG: type VI secretion system protein ImpC [Granulosicoccus sp.]|jgi:type VI secretion system protein ImpC